MDSADVVLEHPDGMAILMFDLPLLVLGSMPLSTNSSLARTALVRETDRSKRRLYPIPRIRRTYPRSETREVKQMEINQKLLAAS